jgi:uncharacterized tellurite resistance protein B-like protein
MFPTKLTQPQREGVLDLLLLGIYADRAVRLAETERVYDLLSPFKWESYQDPREYSQTAISRARAATEDDAAMDDFLARISLRLGHEDVKKLALALLARLIESDDTATESEADFYQKAKAAFGV